jgi:hypothetical protein
MKKIKYFLSLLILIAFAVGCELDKYEDLSSLDTITPPSGVASLFDITNDNSGNVKITPSGEGTGSYDVFFGDGTATPGNVQSGNSIIHSYAEGEYTVKIVAVGINGATAEKTYPLSIVYRAPENLAVTFTKLGLNLKVKAKADYAASFLVYYGDVIDEVGTPLAKGEEIEHNYPAIGTYDVKVVALSGGAAQIEQIFPVTITIPFVFPITFETVGVNYFFGSFGGGQQFTKEANPNPSGINTSATVGRFRRGWDAWSGTYSPLNAPLDFATGHIVKVWVYTPDAVNIGKKLNVELESGTINNGIAVLKVPLTKSGEWEELVFDFSTISAIPANAKFNQLVLRFNDGVNGDFATIYVDNFRFTN